MKIEDCYIGQRVRCSCHEACDMAGEIVSLDADLLCIDVKWDSGRRGTADNRNLTPELIGVSSWASWPLTDEVPLESAATAPNETAVANSGTNYPNQDASAEECRGFGGYFIVDAEGRREVSESEFNYHREKHSIRPNAQHVHNWKHYIGFTGQEAHYYCTKSGCKEIKYEP